MRLSASHASRPKVGEYVNGDAVVFRSEGERGLAAVVDALGHGPTAAEVAAAAVSYLKAVPLTTEIREILLGLHRALRMSRGAAAMVCAFDGDRLEGCGVGNVELRLAGSTVPVVLSPGILGGSVRTYRVFGGKLNTRSRLVLFSDGISSRFSLDGLRALTTGELSGHLLSLYGRDYDDATALVVDCD